MLRRLFIGLMLGVFPLFGALTITGSWDVLSQADYDAWDTNGTTQGAGTITSTSTTVTGVGTNFGNQILPGHLLEVAGDRRMVKSIQSTTSLTLDTAFPADITAASTYIFGQPMHFRGRIDPATGEPVSYYDHVADSNTGITAWSVIQQQAATHGWPLRGMYVSSSGGSTRGTAHFALHRSEIPTQTGSPGQRADKLTTQLETALDTAFQVVTTPPTDDPDCVPDGQGGCQPVTQRPNFRAKWHTWDTTAVRSNDVDTYTFKIAGGGGDYAFRFFADEPPSTWWQELN